MLGFLQGIAQGFGEQAEKRRDENRRQAEMEWEQRKNFLDDYIQGRYGQPTAEGLQEAFSGMAELTNNGIKPKKGRGIMGRARGDLDVALPSLLQRIMDGDASIYEEGRPMEGGTTDQGVPNVRIDQRAAPSGRELAASGVAQPLTPPPDQAQGPGMPGEAPSMKRFAVPQPPAATQRESGLADAAMRGAAAMGANGPLPSTQFSPGKPQRTGPPALFRSPQELAEEQRGIAHEDAMAAAQSAHQQYQYLRSQGYSDSQIRAIQGYSQDPASASSSPYGPASKTFYNPDDPQAPLIEARPSTTGPGWVDAQGNMIPPGYVAQPSSSGGSLVATPGEYGWGILDRGSGRTSAVTYPEGMGGVLGARNAPITERGPAMEQDPDAIQATNALKLIQDEVQMKADNAMLLADEDELAQWTQEAFEKFGRRLGYDSIEDLQMAATAPTERPVQPRSGASLPPPPGDDTGYVGTPGIIPGPGAPQPSYARQLGWLADWDIPSPEAIDTAGPEDLLSWYYNHMSEGQDLMQGIDPQIMYEASYDDPGFIEDIRRKLIELSQAIYGAGR